MRTEHEMLEIIINTAKSDDRIRAVIMNGSRVNPNARRDIFQDFDIVYIVTEVGSFKEDHSWIDRFGEIMILQMPEAMQYPPPRDNGRFVYLMQFADGNRIDLSLFPLAALKELDKDSLSFCSSIRTAFSSRLRLRPKAIICQGHPPPRRSPIAATSSGGCALTSPKDCGGAKSCMRSKCLTDMPASSL